MADVKTQSQRIETALIGCATLMKEFVGELRDPATREKVVNNLNNAFRLKGQDENGGETLIKDCEEAVWEWGNASTEFLVAQSALKHELRVGAEVGQ